MGPLSKRLLLSVLAALLAAPGVATATNPEITWTRSFGDVVDDTVSGVAIDSLGNTYVTGFFAGSVDFGGGPLAINFIDMFIAKYDPAGVHLWSFAHGGDGNDYGIDVALHPSGGIVVTGYFDSATANFGGADLNALGGTDIFVARYDADGNHLWSSSYGGTDVDEAFGVATSSTGQVVVCGSYFGEADFGAGPFTSLGDRDAFVARYDSLGAPDGAITSGGTSSDLATDVAVDGSGNIVFTGHFEGTADFGSGPHVSLGDDDIFVAVVDGVNGAGIWSRAGGGPGQDFGNAVALDSFGNVNLTGSFADTVDFGGGDIVAAGGADGFLVQLNSAGFHNWSTAFGGTLDDQGNAIAVDAADRITVGGGFQSIDAFFGPDSLGSAGGADVCVVQYTSAGTFICVDAYGGSGNDLAIDVDVTGVDQPVVAGALSDTVTIGTTELVSNGLLDGFIAKHSIPSVAVPTTTPGGPITYYAAWPNPFRSRVTLEFSSDESLSGASIRIFDVAGRSVRRLGADSGRTVWDGLDASGHVVPPGIYFARLTTERGSVTRRIVRMR